ncbi:DNA-3-methyladenine glycosylase III [Desulfacinum infernum DSM 9756]|uniref:DNA-3-methyladenine glycosylase III n=1 Tax=Desulfacinum infernum DSM 9756 TaxID=1121391 RepID=A0A1M5BHV5_9BACT|nr:endonuclease III domain-containing protein [Desulfacinum infernum]SHF41792.1 DNA-3-methyladenine glycosylase III [Desulfacinum infernum DSM 9756]
MTPTDRSRLIYQVYTALFDAYGPQGWWPADTPFEVIVGAILTQNTAWKNVRRAIDNLKAEGLLQPEAILRTDEDHLRRCIRPSGYYNQKTKRLLTFCRYVAEQWHGDLEAFLGQEMGALRRELLSLNGIGPETADSIVLYAAHRPSFVVDAYTHRVFSRHGWVAEEVSYEELRNYFMDCLEPDVYLFQELHALIVRVGHEHCRRKASCPGCPLEPFLVE